MLGYYKFLFVGGRYHGHVLMVAGDKVEIAVLDAHGGKCMYYMHDLISIDVQADHVRVPVFVHQNIADDGVTDFVAAVLNGSQAIQPEGSRFTAYIPGADQRWHYINMGSGISAKECLTYT